MSKGDAVSVPFNFLAVTLIKQQVTPDVDFILRFCQYCTKKPLVYVSFSISNNSYLLAMN